MPFLDAETKKKKKKFFQDNLFKKKKYNKMKVRLQPHSQKSKVYHQLYESFCEFYVLYIPQSQREIKLTQFFIAFKIFTTINFLYYCILVLQQSFE